MTSSVQEQPVQAPVPPGPGPQRPPRPRRRALAGSAALLALVAAGIVIALSDPFAGSSNRGADATDNGTPTSLATVRRGTLHQQVNSSGTLAYLGQPDGSPYEVVNQALGALTELPTAGQVIGCGHVLYRVADKPTALLCGGTPAYRSLSEGDTGPDVKELNANLVHLGYATRAQLDPSSDYFGPETSAALERLQEKLGVAQTGSLSLGQVVFLPGPLRIAKATAALGSIVRPGEPLAQATSTHRQVQVNLDASQQSSIKVGQPAQVTLPDNRTTPGTVTRIGTVASSSGSGQEGSSSGGSGSGSSGATIPVYVNLKHPKAAGRLDQAPVQVQITTAGVKNVLIVPANALLARSGGGYAVETVDARGGHHLVPVRVGLFDDADGLVQISGALRAGDQVVVPST